MPQVLKEVGPRLVGWLADVRRPAATEEVILDRERQQTRLRVAVCLAVVLYLFVVAYWIGSTPFIPVWLVLYTIFSLALAARVGVAASSKPWRRYVANFGDVGTISYVMFATQQSGIPLFVLYLWITLGNGFRFGIPALATSAIFSVIGFLAVLASSPAWSDRQKFAIGVLCALIFLPSAAARLIYRTKGKTMTSNEMSRQQRAFGEQKQRAASKLSSATFIKRFAPRRAPTFDDVLIRERGQAILRVVVTAVATIYVFFASWPFDLRGVPGWLVIGTGYTLFSIFLLGHILRSGCSPPYRRYVGNVGDVAAITYGMYTAGDAGIPLFVLYLWVTLGNGFRYGVRALAVSTALSIAGFSIVVLTSAAWRELDLVLGVFISLLVLPFYTGHLLHMLNSALDRAREAHAVKSQFLARMSHELRTPLNGIIGSVELLRNSRRLSPEEHSLLNVIDDSANLSLRQINNVLDFSKIEAGKLILEQANLDLHALVGGVTQMVRPAAKQKGVRLIVRISPTLPYLLVGDSYHLRTILLNLLSNAIKFTDKGSVWLDITGTEERSELVVVRFEIIDTGIGIEPDALARVFDSFVQEDSSTTRRYGGTGLGTTIAKQLVELMNGRIGAQSIKGRGSLFWFEIPFEKSSDNIVEPHRESVARVALLSHDQHVVDQFARILDSVLVPAESEEEVVELFSRGLRLGNPIQLLLVDDAIAFGLGTEHRCTELCDKALASSVPVVLVGDRPINIEQLRGYGYSAVIPRASSPSSVQTLVRASSYLCAEGRSKVATIPPWQWNEREPAGGVRVLVADDNRTNLMIIRRMLEQGGYDVDVVESGDQALDKLCTGVYRLAVLDMHMPILDGPGVARQYRLTRPRSRLPIIVLTANATIAAKQISADAGADAYLSKPVTTRQLLVEVKRLLDATQVEVIPLKAFERSPKQDMNVVDVDISVLADLDRLYRNPAAFNRVIEEYQREGGEALERIADACLARNHPAFCDALHSLKSHAANIGARRLMDACQSAGGIGIVEFIRDRDAILVELRDVFTRSLSALEELTKAPSRNDHRGQEE